MTRIYDGAEHVALENERTRLQNERTALATKMNDEYESDAWSGDDGPAKFARYQADSMKLMQLDREYEAVEKRIDRMEAARPISRAEHKANPLLDIRRRWCKGGSELLDEGERQIFMPEMTTEIAKDLEKRGIPSGGEFFDPWAIATKYSEERLPVTATQRRRARMAVGDPSRSDIDTESAAGAGDALGLAAPETWAAGVVESLQYFGSVAANCHNFNTSDGNSLHQNALDTKDQEGELISDQSQTSTGIPDSTSTTIGNTTDVIFNSYWRTSRFIESRIESFADIHFDVAGRIMREMERRLGRGWNRTFTIGGGGQGSLQATASAAPQGIALSGLIIDGGAGSADDGSGGIDYQNLLDMEYGVDLAYLQDGEGGAGGFTDAHGGMIGWMMHRNVEKQLRLAVFPGTDGLPIWVPDPTNMGIATQRAPGRILGYPYTLNNHMGNGKKPTNLSVHLQTASRDDEVLPPLLFGACGHFAVRNIGGPMYYRFWDSETAKRMAVKFIGWSRRDSRSRGPHMTVDGSDYEGARAADKPGGAASNNSLRDAALLNEAYCVLSVYA